MKEIRDRGFTAVIPENIQPDALVFLIGKQEPEIENAMKQRYPALEIVQILPEDWNRDCTPWEAPGLRRNDPPFGGGADAMARFISETALPAVRACGLLPEGPGRTALAGYSLGGLFALYAACRRFPFQVYGSLSGSLWYPGWCDYLSGHGPKEDIYVYLSLGSKEPLARHPVLSRVGDATRQTAEILQRQIRPGNIFFEWNEGNHFVNIETRFARFADYLKLVFCR